MKGKLLKLYCFLLVLVICTMIMLWQLVSPRQEYAAHDYPTIKKEGILHIAVQTTDTSEAAFYFELSRSISNLSGLEVQLLFLESSEACRNALDDNTCDIVATPLIKSSHKSAVNETKKYSSDSMNTVGFSPWLLREDSPILRDSLNNWLNQIIANGSFHKIKEKYLP